MNAIDIPAFPKVPIAELVADVQTGFASGERDPSGIVQVRMNNLDTQCNLDLSEPTRVPAPNGSTANFRLEPGDVLFNNTNSTELVGKSTVFRGHNEPVVFSNHFSRLRLKLDRIDPIYLARWLVLQQQSGVFARLCNRWVNQSAVRKEALLALAIPLPPLAEQKRIATILDKADAIRHKRQQLLLVYNEVPRAIFLHAMGGHLPPAGSPIMNQLDQYLEFLTSGSRGWAEHYVSVGKRFIRSLDVQMNRISNDDCCFVNPPSGTEADRTRVRDGDVLLTVTGSRIGRVASVPSGFGEAYVSQHVAIMRLKPSLRPRFLSMFLSLADGGQRQIRKAQYGQTKPGLSLAQIRRFEIPVVSINEQDQFCDTWVKFEMAESHARQASTAADQLIHAFVQRAFIGEL